MGSIPLFQKAYTITINTLQIQGANGQGLQCRFTIKKDLKGKPNSLELQIWNLNPAHRNALAGLPTIPVQVEAGYASGTSVVFIGDVRTVDAGLSDKTERITKIGAGDGEKKIQTARVATGIRKGQATPIAVLKAAAVALGVDPGNLNTAVAQLAIVKPVFTEGCVLYGSASREMSRVCKALGLEWSVQNGKLQLTPIGVALAGEAIFMASTTGMLGSPSLDPVTKILKVRCLMIPDVFPGRKLVLQAEQLSGNFRIEKTTHQGDFLGSDWFVDLECKAY